MKCHEERGLQSGSLSEAARRRLLEHKWEPLFYAAWSRVMFIHLEVDAREVGKIVPFELDLHEGRAYVSLVAFTMFGMHPRCGGRLGKLLFRPFSDQRFLNVRTYVKHGNETGIYFLAEWLSDALSVRLGPLTFGLPYRHAAIDYEHDHESGRLHGEVKCSSGQASIIYDADVSTRARFEPVREGLLDKFLMERYTAFTDRGFKQKLFRIWHPPWPQCPVEVEMSGLGGLEAIWLGFSGASVVGANYSPGFEQVWMGWPHGIKVAQINTCKRET